MSMHNGLARRLDRLEQLAADLGLDGACRHRLHDCPEVRVMLTPDQQVSPAPCPGCGAERPLSVVRLVRMWRDERGDLVQEG